MTDYVTAKAFDRKGELLSKTECPINVWNREDMVQTLGLTMAHVVDNARAIGKDARECSFTFSFETRT
jgi:hypothetical protein